MFYRVVSEFSATGCSHFFSWKSSKCTKISQLTHLMSIVLFYTLWKFWFFILSGIWNRLVSWNVLRGIFWVWIFLERETIFNLECEKNYFLLKSIYSWTGFQNKDSKGFQNREFKRFRNQDSKRFQNQDSK